jgi:RecJ-like exonuclease
MQSVVSNQQPLYVQDFAKDKVGAVVNNKGVVKPYTNMGINEQVQNEVCDECGAMQMSEGECMECGWKGEVGAMEEAEELIKLSKELEFPDGKEKIEAATEVKEDGKAEPEAPKKKYAGIYESVEDLLNGVDVDE